MAFNYQVSYSTSSSGPWTPFNTVTTNTDVIPNLVASTSYFVRIITVDTVSGLTSSPVISGPFATKSNAPVPTFTDTFDSFLSNKWFYNSFDEGGDSFWTNDSSLTPIVYTYSNSKLHLALAKKPVGSTVTTKSYISGIMDTFNVNNFAQRFGYWEVTVAVDKLIGFIYEQITLSNGSIPPDHYIRIWTDSNNVQQLLFQSTFDIFYATNSSAGFDPSISHAYGVEWTSTNINYYIDRVQVLTATAPVGFDTGASAYSKMHVNTNFQAAPTIANPAALPVFAHVDSFNVWATRPF